MATVERPTGVRTHEVTNQAPPLVDYNLFEANQVLVEAVDREGADWAKDRISAVGEYGGSARAVELGFQANQNPPKLKTHDRYGNRVDEVEFHPAWHELLGAAVANELHSLPWTRPAARRPRRPRRLVHVLLAGRGRGRLPDLDDLLGDPGAAPPARAGRGVGAPLHLERVRPRATSPRPRSPAPWPAWG